MRNAYQRLKLYFKINWTKTIYFNLKKFPLHIALKFPVFFYGKVKFTSLTGSIIIDAPITTGMIGFGQPYEMTTVSKGIAEFFLDGTIFFKGFAQFGKDYFIYIAKNASAEFGNMSSMASSGKIICTNNIVLGNYARLGSESQIIDTNFHEMINTDTQEIYPMTAPIEIGSYNFIGNRVSIMSKTITPDFCTIASNSVCNKDYLHLGSNILIGGIPSKLLKTDISRNWVAEQHILEKYLVLY